MLQLKSTQGFTNVYGFNHYGIHKSYDASNSTLFLI